MLRSELQLEKSKTFNALDHFRIPSMTMFWKIKENLRGEELCEWERKTTPLMLFLALVVGLQLQLFQAGRICSLQPEPGSAQKQSCQQQSGRQVGG